MAVIYCGRKEEGVVVQSGMTHRLLPFTPYVPPMGSESKWAEVSILRAAKTEAGMPRCSPERRAELLLVEAYDPNRHDYRIRDYIEEMGIRAKELDLSFAAYREAALAQERADVPEPREIHNASITELLVWLKRAGAIEQDADPKKFWGKRTELRERCLAVFGHVVNVPRPEKTPPVNTVPRQAKNIRS